MRSRGLPDSAHRMALFATTATADVQRTRYRYWSGSGAAEVQATDVASDVATPVLTGAGHPGAAAPWGA